MHTLCTLLSFGRGGGAAIDVQFVIALESALEPKCLNRFCYSFCGLQMSTMKSFLNLGLKIVSFVGVSYIKNKLMVIFIFQLAAVISHVI